MYEFEFRTGKVSVDHGRCVNCTTYACVKACSLCGSGILRIKEGKLVLAVGSDEAIRLCIECLACEYDCLFEGQKAITIVLPIPGLDELRSR